MRTILALDLGRFNEKTHGGIFTEHQGLARRLKVATNAASLASVLDDAKANGVSAVVFESQPGAWQVADLVRARGMQAVIANTHDEGFAWRRGVSKSDEKDVSKLAGMHLRGEIRGISIPTDPERVRRSLVHSRQSLVKMRTATMNRIRALGIHHWVPLPEGNSCWTVAGRAVLSSLSQDKSLSLALRVGMSVHLAMLSSIEEQIQVIERTLDATRKELPRVRQLMDQVPGIGPCTADAITARIGDPDRTGLPARSAGALLGLTPSRRQSGKTVINGPITRHGDGAARGCLIEAAQRARTSAPEWKALYLRYTKGSDDPVCTGKAIVALARRLAVTCAAILRTGKTYDPELIMPRSSWDSAA